MHAENVVIYIDFTAVIINPIGSVLWKKKVVSTCRFYKNQEILQSVTKVEPTLIRIDAPLSLFKKETMRRGGQRKGYIPFPRVPPCFQAIKKLILYAMKMKQ